MSKQFSIGWGEKRTRGQTCRPPSKQNVGLDGEGRSYSRVGLRGGGGANEVGAGVMVESTEGRKNKNGKNPHSRLGER